MEYTYNVFLLLGGVAMFLFGINFMSQSLYEALGDNLRTILEKLTAKPLNAVLLGACVTALIQSSGATMVMVTGFVAAQIMSLERGLLVMLGAWIGTTITAQIIAFDIAPFSPLIFFVGLIMYQFIKSRKSKRIGAVILGFGLLFMGIYLMGEAIEKMSLGTLVMAFLERVSNPFIGFLFGFVLTFIIQSSSASVGILQVMLADASGFNLAGVTFLIIGMNVGAVAPVVLAAMSGNRGGKRAAFAAVISKLLSAIICIVIIIAWPGCINLIANSASDVSRQIANFHLIYNIAGTIALLPLIRLVTKMSYKFVPEDLDDNFYARKLLYIGKGQDKAPAVMIAQCRQEIFRFADIVKENYHNSMDAFFNEDVELAETVTEREKLINFLNKEIYLYLLNLHGKLLPEKDLETVGRMFNILSDLERIGDHADNIAGYTIVAKEQHATVSKKAFEELKDMGYKSVKITDDAIEAYRDNNFDLLYSVQKQEDVIDELKLRLENNHIERMRERTCDPRGGTLFIDVIVDYERVADHALNIAETLLGADAPVDM